MTNTPIFDDISIDLESLDVGMNAAILSIGAVEFDRNTGQLGAEFYREITVDSALRCGSVSGAALSWWMQQEKAAKRIFSPDSKTPLSVALDDLRTFYKARKLGPSGLGPCVWGNGIIFDITALQNGYDNGAIGLHSPWHFLRIRDMRTIVDAAGWPNGVWPVKKTGVNHHALDDAKHQAIGIAQCFSILRGVKPVDPEEEEL